MTWEKLEELRYNAVEFLKLVTDHRSSQFTPVVIPLEIVLAESERTINQLAKIGLNIRTVILNQIYPSKDQKQFFTDLRREQDAAISSLRTFGMRPPISQSNLLDGVEKSVEHLTSISICLCTYLFLSPFSVSLFRTSFVEGDQTREHAAS